LRTVSQKAMVLLNMAGKAEHVPSWTMNAFVAYEFVYFVGLIMREIKVMVT